MDSPNSKSPFEDKPMKTLLTFATILLALVLLSGCDTEPTALQVDNSDAPPALHEGDVNTVSFSVPSMECEGCAATVKDALASTAGVEQCVVNLDSHVAICKVNPDTFKAEDVLKALADAGYKDSTVKN
jgi:copper chaperone CopZ